MDLLGYLSDDDDDLFDLLLLNYLTRPRRRKRFRARPDFFTKWDDREFKARFRLSKGVVRFIIDAISEKISSRTDRNHAVSPTDMVLLTLRFLATGNFLQVTGDFCGVNKSTASRVIEKVTTAIASLKKDFICMPSSNEEITSIKQEFYNLSKFPQCIGALDCTHVKIHNPGGPLAETFRNKKSFFSLKVQVVSDCDLQIRNIVCRWPGASRSSHIFKNSRLRQEFENGKFGDSLLVASNSYAAEPYLVTPLPNPSTPVESLYNKAHMKTFSPVKKLFEVWKRRFPVLALGIRLHIRKVEAVIVACAVLHNIACNMSDEDLLSNDKEIETAIHLTNSVSDNVDNIEICGIRDALRRDLIKQHFQKVL